MTIYLPCPLGALFPGENSDMSFRFLQYDIIMDGRPALRVARYPDPTVITLFPDRRNDSRIPVIIPDDLLEPHPARDYGQDTDALYQWSGVTFIDNTIRHIFAPVRFEDSFLYLELPALSENLTHILADPKAPETYNGRSRSLLSLSFENTTRYFYSPYSVTPGLHMEAIRFAGIEPGEEPSYESIQTLAATPFNHKPAYRNHPMDEDVGRKLDKSIGSTAELAMHIAVNLDSGTAEFRFNNLLLDAQPVTLLLKDATALLHGYRNEENQLKVLGECLKHKHPVEMPEVQIGPPGTLALQPELEIQTLYAEDGAAADIETPLTLPHGAQGLKHPEQIEVGDIRCLRPCLDESFRKVPRDVPFTLDELICLDKLLTNQCEPDRVIFNCFVELWNKDEVYMTPRQCIELCAELRQIGICPDVPDQESYERVLQPETKREKLRAGGIFDVSFEPQEDGLPGDANFYEGNLIVGGSEFSESDFLIEPPARLFKVRLTANDDSTQGAWINIPLNHRRRWDHLPKPLEANGIEDTAEVYMALKKLGVTSLNDCKITHCETQYPWIAECFKGNYTSLSGMLAAAHKAATKEIRFWEGEAYMQKLQGIAQFTGCQHSDLLADLAYSMGHRGHFIIKEDKLSIVCLHMEKRRGARVSPEDVEYVDLDAYLRGHKDEIQHTDAGYIIEGTGTMEYRHYRPEPYNAAPAMDTQIMV